MSYTKLFSSIVTSSIWTEDPSTCKVWVTMLAIADKHGEVHASIPGLAQVAGMPLSDTEAAINKFLAPDKYSRTPDDEGRRIEKIEGGWLLLNHAKYRAMASKDEEKSSAAKRQAAFRERQKRNGRVTARNDQVTVANCVITVNADIAEAEAEAEAKNTPIPPKPPAPPSLVLEVQESKPSLTPEQIEIGSWFNRRPTTPWSEKELKVWAKIPKPIDSEDWQALRWFYTQSGCQFLRRDLLTLLNNWTGEIDRAKNYNPDQK